MKKLSILLLITAAAAIFFSSCNKEYAVPTIAWTPDALSQFVTVGDETTYNKTLEITFGAEAGIKTIEINKYIYVGMDYTLVALDGPTGYTDLLTFDYTLTTNNLETDFGGGVTSIVYEVVVTDNSETPQSKAKEYTFFVDEAYTVTINVEDEEGTAIEDATVTFNTVEMTAAPYVYDYIMSGTYTYSVEKTGYQTVNVSDFAMVDSDTTFTVTLIENIAAAWSADIPLALSTETAWAEYLDEVIGVSENTTIGFAFTFTDGAIFRVEKTDGCDGWVLIDEADALAYTTGAEIEAAYTAGTVIDTYDLPATFAKTYEARYFVSKVGDEYLLVKYAYGYRDGGDNTGNVVVFQYKN